MDSQWGLDDLLADLHDARRRDDLGRLAFVSYCDVRRWARDAGHPALAEQAARLVTDSPHQTRDDFLAQVEQLILELQTLQGDADSDDETRRHGGRAPALPFPA